MSSSSTSKQAELRRLMKLQLEKQQEQEQEKDFQPRGILKTKKTAAIKTNSGNSGVSSLMAAYNDSDSDDSDVDTASNVTNEKSTRVSWPSEEVELKQTRIFEPAPSEPTPPRKRARLEPQTGGLTDERIQAIQAEMGITSTPTTTTNILVGNTETEDEFQALLNDNITNTSEATATDASNRQQATTNDQEDEIPSVDTTELEQMSYQARIAQLRLKAAARRNKKQSAAPLTAIDTYTPELALGNNEEEEEDQNGNEIGSELNPLEILRRKRLEAKKSRE